MDNNIDFEPFPLARIASSKRKQHIKALIKTV